MFFRQFLQCLHRHSVHFQYLIFGLNGLTLCNYFIFKDTKLKNVVESCFEDKIVSIFCCFISLKFLRLYLFFSKTKKYLWKTNFMNYFVPLCRYGFDIIMVNTYSFIQSQKLLKCASCIIISLYIFLEGFLEIFFINLLNFREVNANINRQLLRWDFRYKLFLFRYL